MSDTPARLSNTTSLALWSIRIDAARCASSADVGADCGTEAAMWSGACGPELVSGKSGARVVAGRAESRRGLVIEPPPDRRPRYCLMTQTRISGFTDACNFTGTR